MSTHDLTYFTEDMCSAHAVGASIRKRGFGDATACHSVLCKKLNTAPAQDLKIVPTTKNGELPFDVPPVREVTGSGSRLVDIVEEVVQRDIFYLLYGGATIEGCTHQSKCRS